MMHYNRYTGRYVRRVHWALLTLLVVSAGSPGVLAQSRWDKWKLTFAAGAGICMPAGSLSNAYTNGWCVSGAAGVSFSQLPFDLRIEGGYDHVATPGSFFGTPRFGGFSSLSGGCAQILVRPPNMPHATPYALAGLGIYRIKSELLDFAYYGSGDYAISDIKPGWTLGMGMRIQWSGFGFFLEWRYLRVSPAAMSRIMLGFAYN